MDLRADDITALLRQSEAGDRAAGERLLGCIYTDLRRIARARLRGERGETLDTTGLVHEAWLAMDQRAQAGFADRKHYFAYAARAMRHILIDRARQRAADKRQPIAAPEDEPIAALDLAMLDQALDRLGALSPRLARVVELRLLAGLTHAEIGAMLAVTERTVERDWLKARALLAQWLEPA
jgi:RNA polymerase sigma factor (TIGR02999 family)